MSESLRLELAVLCVNCELIYSRELKGCPHCTSPVRYSLSRAFGSILADVPDAEQEERPA